MTDEELLDALVGQWLVTGEMRGQPLTQRWAARRTLAGRFVEVRVTDGTPLIDGRPYETAYFVGVSGESVFSMTLMDIFGAAYSTTPGRGRRDGDAIVFTFAYESGPWTWRWSRTTTGWDTTQTFIEDGETRVFAEKRLQRLPSSAE